LPENTGAVFPFELCYDPVGKGSRETAIMSLERSHDVLHKPFGREELRPGSHPAAIESAPRTVHRSEVAMLKAQINPHFLHKPERLGASCFEDTKDMRTNVMLSEYFRLLVQLSRIQGNSFEPGNRTREGLPVGGKTAIWRKT
jgi:hypothetical protein